MEHIAIDLGKRESQVCIRGPEGNVVEERRVMTGRLKRYLQRRPKSRVILETCSEAFAIADAARAEGHDVRVVSATLVKSLGVGARGIKTDRRDAQVLSEVSCRITLPSVHVPSLQSRERKALCGMRDCLVEVRTKLINSVRGWARTKLKAIRTGAISTFPSRVRQKALETPEGLPMYVERQLLAIEALSEQIAQADEELLQLTSQDERCQRLMSAPGVGPVTALRFVSTLDDVERFGGTHAVQSYLGLTPGEHSSSTRQQKTSITKAGPARVRWTLVQAAWCAMRCAPDDAMVRWANQIAQRRGRRIAVVALARKLAGILYAMWRDGTFYQSTPANPSTEGLAPT
jgi:transposase